MQHLGPVIILSMVVLSAMLVKNRHSGDTSLTISQHVALDGYNSLYFGIYEVLIAAGFFWFVAAWFAPTLSLPIGYSVIAGIGLSGLALAGISPHKPGTSGFIHNIGAYTMAFGMYLMVLGVAVFATVPLWLTGLSWFISAYMTFGIGAMIFAKKRFEPKMLYYQALYFALFYLIIILATYFHS